MDPYGDQNKKIKSPLDKPAVKSDNETQEKNTTNNNMDENNKSDSSSNTATKENRDAGKTEEENPAIMEHITELRKQLIKSIAVFLCFFILVFSTINIWFPYITRGYKLVVLGPIEVLSFYTSISAALAFGLSVPFLCHFLWKFVKPGLKENEGRFFSLYAPIIFLLFLGGLVFGYYIVNPLSYNFLVKIGQINFDLMISAREYARFLLLTTMPIGLMFELPVAALFLSSIGLLSSASMKKIRKYSYIVLAVVSALITPPDFISQLIVLIPMIGLYEASIFIVVRTEKRIVTSDATT